MEFEHVKPMEIEARSFEIIGDELEKMGITLDKEKEPIIKRVIHTTADFDYVDNLVFSKDACGKAYEAIKAGATIVTDTKMAWSGINKKALESLGMKAINFMDDPEVAQIAKRQGCTRSAVCMDQGAKLSGPVIFAIGNAPTALIRLRELYDETGFKPSLIIGVPVGFVNVVQSKESIMETDIPYIIAKGRKGGSNVAAAICNALLYQVNRPIN